MNLPVQSQPVIRNFSEASSLNDEYGIKMADKQKCWSARNCSGKVLNNRDRHNCTNSGGKSWQDSSGNCFNL